MKRRLSLMAATGALLAAILSPAPHAPVMAAEDGEP